MMLDELDYKEPSCALCGGKEFYNPDKDQPDGRIPVMRVIEKLDGFLNKNLMDDARVHLEYWKNEASALRDKQGELAVTDELIGLYRKTGERELAFSACDRALALLKELGLDGTVTSATVLLNAATAYKAFGKAQDALPLYERAQKIYDGHLQPDDPLVAGLYNNTALALADLKRYGEAEEFYLKAIAITEKTDTGAPDAAISYVNLAHCYYEQKKDKSDITDCMFKAYGLLCGENVPQNGYLAYVLSKCYPSFEFFGYGRIAAELKEKSEKLYAGA